MDSNSIKKWNNTVSSFGQLSDSVWWSKGFCLYYYLRTFSSITPFSKNYWLNIFYQYGSTIYRILRIFMSIFLKKSTLQGPDYVFLTDYNPSYMSSLIPVIEETLAITNNVAILKPRSVSPKTSSVMETFFNKYASYSICYEDLISDYSLLERIVTFMLSISAAIKDTFRFFQSDIEYKFYFTPPFFKYAIIHRFYRNCATRFLKHANTIISCNDHHLWESLIFQSVCHETCTIVIQHGFLGEFANPLFADIFLAWSKEDKIKMTSELGSEHDRIIVAGSPKYDEILSVDSRETYTNSDRSLITFLSQSHGAETLGLDAYRKIVQMFYKLADDFRESDYKFIIKLHPFDKDEFYHALQKEYQGNVTIVREDISHIMKNTFASISVSSTAIFESVIYNAISIQVYTDGITRFDDYSGTGLALLCKGYDQLSMTFDRLVNDDHYADIIRRRSYESLMQNHLAKVGFSKQFIADYLTSLLKTTKNSFVSGFSGENK